MRTTLLLLCWVATALFAEPVHAQVFKCKGPNGIVYQDGPCEGGTAVDARSASGVKNSAGAAQSGSRGDSGTISTKPTHPVVPEKMRR